MATFRDFVLDADRHLVAAAGRIGVLAQPDAAQIAGELAMLSRICGRILDDVLDGYPEDSPERRPEHAAEDARWRSEAQSGRNRIRAAVQKLERAASTYGPKNGHVPRRVPHPSPDLRAAIQRLGLAEESLQSELTPGDPGERRPRLPGSTGLGDRDTAREITALTGRWVGLVGAVADGIAGQIQATLQARSVRVEPLPQLLRQASSCTWKARAVITAVTGQITQVSGRLAVLPRARTGLAPKPKSAPEPVKDLLGQAKERAATLRTALNTGPPGLDHPPDGPDAALHGPPSTISVRSLRYIATSAGSSHTAAAIVARQLAARVAELHGSATPECRALANAADALIHSGRAWYAAARGWDPITTRRTETINRRGRAFNPGLIAATTHAMSTVMRLGQAAYADPDWTPDSANTAVRPAADYGADLEEVRRAAGHLGEVVTAFTGAAHASDYAIGTLIYRKALYAAPGDQPGGRPGDEPGSQLGTEPVPARPTDVARLRYSYDAVLQRAVTAERWLRTASAPTPRDPADAPALAATAFPKQPLARPEPTASVTQSAPTAPGSPAVSASASTPPPVPAHAAVRAARRSR